MIVTFYSYKGGVGRSMALANVARWLQLRGLAVRVVDWDLEAPGVDTFFYDSPAELARARSQFGLIDILTSYVERHPSLVWPPKASGALDLLRMELPPIAHAFICPPSPKAGHGGESPGRLELLGAGRRDEDNFAAYADAVHAFDWQGLYANANGLAYFDWMREQLQADCDVVLIDSRTGVTEMGGVCTRQMADVVVVMTAPNDQNLDGTKAMVQSFVPDDELAAERSKRELHLLLVPARVDMNSEYKDRFAAQFLALAKESWPLHKSPVSPWDLRIPYVTRYAYREQLAIGEADGDSDLQFAYKTLSAHIAWLAETKAQPRLMARMRSEFDRVFGADFTRKRFRADDVLRGAMNQLEQDERRALARSLLTRMIVVPKAKDAPLFPRQIALDFLDSASRALAEVLIDALVLVRSVGGGKSLVGFADPDLVETESIRRWVEEDRDFLHWRQRLQNYFEDWHEGGGRSGGLLGAPLLEEAERVRASPRPHELLFESEEEFIRASRVHIERVEEAEKSAIRAHRVQEELQEQERRAKRAEQEALERARRAEADVAETRRKSEEELREVRHTAEQERQAVLAASEAGRLLAQKAAEDLERRNRRFIRLMTGCFAALLATVAATFFWRPREIPTTGQEARSTSAPAGGAAAVASDPPMVSASSPAGSAPLASVGPGAR